MKRILSICLSILFLLTALPLGAVSVAAATPEEYLDYFFSRGEVTIVGYTDAMPADVVIPAYIQNCPVTCITEAAFGGCDILQSIAIPDTVVGIGLTAFSRCSALTDVYYGGTEEDREAMNIDFGNDALLNAQWHYSVDIDFGKPEEPGEAGYLTRKVENGKVTITGYTADVPANLVIPATLDGYPVVAMANHAFYDCKALVSVTIPESMTTLVDNAFRSCSNLTTVILPRSVTEIGDQAFLDCRSITDVYYGGNEADRAAIAIGSFNNYLIDATWHYAGSDSPATPGEPDYIAGDADGDGKVKVRDLALMERYINNWDVEIVVDACDVNGDGKVNVHDLAVLERYLNGWDVQLG